MNATDYQDVVFGFDFSDRFGNQPRIGRIDLTRFQRASKSASESTRGGGHDVVEGSGMRFQHISRNLIMVGDFVVNAKNHGCGLSRKISPSYGAFHPLNPNVGTIYDARHDLQCTSLVLTAPALFAPAGSSAP